MLLARADELEALLRLSLGDLRSPAELASGLPVARRGLLLARIALAAGDHHAAQQHSNTPCSVAPFSWSLLTYGLPAWVGKGAQSRGSIAVEGITPEPLRRLVER